MPERRVVVTGLGVLAPNAHGLEAFDAALRAGKSGIRFQPRLADLKFGCQVGGIPEDISHLAQRYFSEEERFALNENMVFALIASLDAWLDAGLEKPTLETEPDWQAGAIFGTGIGGIDTIAEQLVPKTDSGRASRMGSSMVEQVMASGNSAKLAGALALGNQVTTNSSACSTGTEAVCMAFERIRSGAARRMLAGGSESSSRYIWAGFDAMRVLSRRFNDQPELASRPFSASAGGFVPGSGAGALVLEDLDTAEQRGARIYAEVVSGHVNCGGQRQGGSITAQNPSAVRRCIRAALDAGGLRADQVSFINGHLTATGADANEVVNWASALEARPERLPYIQSTKGLIGHCLGAAGAIECVATILQLQRGFLHPSINCTDLRPDLEPFAARIVRALEPHAQLSVAMKASFGFGDVNSAVVFRRWPAPAHSLGEPAATQ